MAFSNIQAVRLLIQDNTPGLYVISDYEINFLLERNNQSINRTALEAARIILLNLAMRGDDTVDIFSIKGAKAAEQYRLALQLFLKDPNLNPALTMSQAYFGGVSKSDMELNDANLDNNTSPRVTASQCPSGYFNV
jgi:hypothetical protein